MIIYSAEVDRYGYYIYQMKPWTFILKAMQVEFM